MLILKTKKDCTFCRVLKFHLDQENVSYTEENTKGTAPILLKDGETVYVGLPPLSELQNFLKSLN